MSNMEVAEGMESKHNIPKVLGEYDEARPQTGLEVNQSEVMQPLP